MGFRVVVPDRLDWITRPHEPGEPAHTRANVWRYEPPGSENATLLD